MNEIDIRKPSEVAETGYDLRTIAFINFSDENCEDDQRELVTLFHVSSSLEIQQEIIRNLNPNFEFCLHLICKLSVDPSNRRIAGTAFLRIAEIDDYELRREVYRRLAERAPHPLIKKMSARWSAGLENVISLSRRRRNAK